MTDNNMLKKAIFTMIVIFFSATMLYAMVNVDFMKHVANAETGHEIYYSDDEYSDNGESTIITESIVYATKEVVNDYKINNSFPEYYNTNSSLINACANVAGANVIGYYDRYYVNLIPNYTPGMTRGANYVYYPMSNNSSVKQNLINDLYVLMGTNSPNPGTPQSGYKNGITAYVNSAGYNVTYNSVMTNNSLDINKLNNALNNGDPVSLYLSEYNIVTLYDNGSSANLTKLIFTGNHIMIVYGYKIINYYDSNYNLIKTNTYLYVSTGMSQAKGYYLLNNNGVINDAEAVHIS